MGYVRLGNSVYSLVITTAIFPIFYNALTSERNEAGEIVNDVVTFFGAEFINTQLYSYVLAASFIVVIIAHPSSAGWRMPSGKLQLMKIFCYTGSLACMSMHFFDAAHLEWSMLSLFLANIGFWGSLGFYNAFLPKSPTRRTRQAERKGYALDHVGSVLLLLVCRFDHGRR